VTIASKYNVGNQASSHSPSNGLSGSNQNAIDREFGNVIMIARNNEKDQSINDAIKLRGANTLWDSGNNDSAVVKNAFTAFQHIARNYSNNAININDATKAFNAIKENQVSLYGNITNMNIGENAKKELLDKIKIHANYYTEGLGKTLIPKREFEFYQYVKSLLDKK
jgi:hypothetical protein